MFPVSHRGLTAHAASAVMLHAAFVGAFALLALGCGNASPGGSAQPGTAPNASEKTAEAAELQHVRIELILTGPSVNDPFRSPNGVAIAVDGSIYVADSGPKRLVQFDASGRFLGEVGSGDAAKGGLVEPIDVAASPDGSVVVLDRSTGNIVTYDAAGVVVRSYPGPGLYNPFGIGSGPTGVVVADTGTGRLIRFEANGDVAAEFAGREVASGATFDPSGVTTEPDGTIVAADGARGTLQRYKPDGSFISGFDAAANGLARVVRLRDGSFLLSDPARSRLVRWAADGKFIARYAGSDDVEIVHPTGLAVDATGAVYVVDTDMNRVLKVTLP